MEQPCGSAQPLNVSDALSYLDLVRQQLAEEPRAYEKFLNIMINFKSQIIDTPEVVERVANLFHAHPSLIQGFNVFLPAGYRIDTGGNVDPNTITLVTPSGSTTHDLNAAFRQLTMTETVAEIA